MRNTAERPVFLPSALWRLIFLELPFIFKDGTADFSHVSRNTWRWDQEARTIFSTIRLELIGAFKKLILVFLLIIKCPNINYVPHINKHSFPPFIPPKAGWSIKLPSKEDALGSGVHSPNCSATRSTFPSRGLPRAAVDWFWGGEWGVFSLPFCSQLSNPQMTDAWRTHTSHIEVSKKVN